MDENISSYSKVKSSVQRNIRNKILEQYPQLEKMEEDLLPKKEPMFVAKWYVSVYHFDLHLNRTWCSTLALTFAYVVIIIYRSSFTTKNRCFSINGMVLLCPHFDYYINVRTSLDFYHSFIR